MKNYLAAALPYVIKRRIFRIVQPILKDYWEKVLDEIPNYKLKDKHIRNTRLITTREQLLKLLPMGGIVAELGVDEGKFSEMILKINKPKKLHLIDFWGSKRYNQNKRKSVEKKFKKEISNTTVEINLGLSTQVVNKFEDDYFNWIYIDTSHSYKMTIEELESYSRKVKKNGFIAGHDYITGNWRGMVKYGVIEAVYEFCAKHDWEIVFLTSEIGESPSFAIKRIDGSLD